MKTSKAILAIIILIIIGVIAFAWSKKNTEVINNTPPAEQVASIEGCYVAGTSQDIYTLNIESQTGSNVSGKIEFKNFEKDSSSGTFTGTYQDGILLGDYSFRSEGMDSIMQVIFKKSGDDFIRGYGDVNGEGTRFTDLNNITYDATSSLSVFKKGTCPDTSSTSQIIFPAGGETFVAGQKYILRWQGGPDPMQIFLVDTSLKSVGASVSISDRVYGLKNTGTYQYTIPSRTTSGTYELQIGNSTSNTFKVIKG